MRQSFAAAFIFVALAVAVAAQQPRPDAAGSRAVAPTVTPATSTQPDVDENFELNIVERRITERDFFASTSIEAGESSAHGLSLRVGVAVGASEIDVLLRNVQGRVRFRGSLEALQRILDARRPAAAETTARPRVP
ncbi:MAG TPA: hypothetical protein VGX24_10280 [Pyrinomonadaceae bacterium]|jgi:hypothetical protein|nr:hypothetical protein [Pyrinomonadaceae bacterium]